MLNIFKSLRNEKKDAAVLETEQRGGIYHFNNADDLIRIFHNEYNRCPEGLVFEQGGYLSRDTGGWELVLPTKTIRLKADIDLGRFVEINFGFYGMNRKGEAGILLKVSEMVPTNFEPVLKQAVNIKNGAPVVQSKFIAADEIILRNGESFEDFVLTLGHNGNLANVTADDLRAMLAKATYVEPEIDNETGDITDEYKYVPLVLDIESLGSPREILHGRNWREQNRINHYVHTHLPTEGKWNELVSRNLNGERRDELNTPTDINGLRARMNKLNSYDGATSSIVTFEYNRTPRVLRTFVLGMLTTEEQKELFRLASRQRSTLTHDTSEVTKEDALELLDFYELVQKATVKGLPDIAVTETSKTISSATVSETLPPVVTKPVTNGKRGMRVFNTAEELVKIFEDEYKSIPEGLVFEQGGYLSKGPSGRELVLPTKMIRLKEDTELGHYVDVNYGFYGVNRKGQTGIVLKISEVVPVWSSQGIALQDRAALMKTKFFTADEIILRNGESFEEFILPLRRNGDVANITADDLKAMLAKASYVEPEIDNVTGDLVDEYKYVPLLLDIESVSSPRQILHGLNWRNQHQTNHYVHIHLPTEDEWSSLIKENIEGAVRDELNSPSDIYGLKLRMRSLNDQENVASSIIMFEWNRKPRALKTFVLDRLATEDQQKLFKLAYAHRTTLEMDTREATREMADGVFDFYELVQKATVNGLPDMAGNSAAG